MTASARSNAAEIRTLVAKTFRQLPYAASVALNRTALEIVEEQRRGMSERFTIRRQWVLQGVRMDRGDFATKRRLRAVVRLDPSRGFLAQHEEGGTRTARRSSLAIPAAVRRSPRQVIRAADRPRAMGFGKAVDIGGGRSVRRGTMGRYMVQDAAGRGFVLSRAQSRSGGGTATVLYRLQRQVRIPARLRFAETAKRVTDSRLAANMAAAFAEALRTAR